MERTKALIAAHRRAIAEKQQQKQELEAEQSRHMDSIRLYVFNYIVANPDKLHQNTVFECQATAVPTSPDDLELDGWECPTSPTGECVYNDVADPMLDYCLFCGEPYERK